MTWIAIAAVSAVCVLLVVMALRGQPKPPAPRYVEDDDGEVTFA